MHAAQRRRRGRSCFGTAGFVDRTHASAQRSQPRSSGTAAGANEAQRRRPSSPSWFDRHGGTDGFGQDSRGRSKLWCTGLWLGPNAVHLLRWCLLLAVGINVLAFPFLLSFEGPVSGSTNHAWFAVLLAWTSSCGSMWRLALSRLSGRAAMKARRRASPTGVWRAATCSRGMACCLTSCAAGLGTPSWPPLPVRHLGPNLAACSHGPTPLLPSPLAPRPLPLALIAPSPTNPDTALSSQLPTLSPHSPAQALAAAPSPKPTP